MSCCSCATAAAARAARQAAAAAAELMATSTASSAWRRADAPNAALRLALSVVQGAAMTWHDAVERAIAACIVRTCSRRADIM